MSLAGRLADLRHRSPPLPIDPILRRMQQIYEVGRWMSSGRKGAAPHLVKQRLVRTLARQCGTPVFVETGTYLGDMCLAMRRRFRAIYSIELDRRLHQRAMALFAGDPHVTVLHGDSAATLPRILDDVDVPCLFWLDGHYSSGVTARGSVDYPIIAELGHIGAHPVDRHVVPIDDAGLFTGTDGTPSLSEVIAAARAAAPDHRIEVTHDVIIVAP